MVWCVVCCKQKTAYEMRISDWSSDVCSSDLAVPRQSHRRRQATRIPQPPDRDSGGEQRGLSACGLVERLDRALADQCGKIPAQGLGRLDERDRKRGV